MVIGVERRAELLIVGLEIHHYEAARLQIARKSFRRILDKPGEIIQVVDVIVNRLC